MGQCGIIVGQDSYGAVWNHYGAGQLWGSMGSLWSKAVVGQYGVIMEQGSCGAVWGHYGAGQLWGSVGSLWGRAAMGPPHMLSPTPHATPPICRPPHRHRGSAVRGGGGRPGAHRWGPQKPQLARAPHLWGGPITSVCPQAAVWGAGWAARAPPPPSLPPLPRRGTMRTERPAMQGTLRLRPPWAPPGDPRSAPCPPRPETHRCCCAPR